MVDRTKTYKVETPKDVWNAPGTDSHVKIPKIPKSEPDKKEFDWMPWVTSLGGGLLLHSVASSLMNNKSDEEKRRESIWERLLSAIIPLGIGGLGMYGGYRVGNLMKSATVTNDWLRVISPNGGQAKVPEVYADHMDALFEHLPDDHGSDITVKDIDAAIANLNNTVKSDKGPGGDIVRGAQYATTGLQPLAYGVGAGIAGYGGYQIYKNRPAAVKKNEIMADTVIKDRARAVDYIRKQPQEYQQIAAVENGYLTPKEFFKGVKQQNELTKANSEVFRKNAPKKRVKGAKRVAKSLPWIAGGAGLTLLDSYLENANEKALKDEEEAKFWKLYGPKVKGILNGSKDVE